MERDYLPKYIKVKNLIEKSIEEGIIRLGDKIPTENELTDRYNVSRHTVRKALDLLEREGVLEKRQGIGSFYRGKKNTQNGKSRNIGFISISLHDYIFSDILSGIDQVLHQNAYQIILGNSQDNLEREKGIIEQFMQKDIDGLIIEPAKSAISQSNLTLLQDLLEKEIPIVTLDSKYSDERINSVRVDDEMGGMIATDYLSEMGHKKIAIIYKSMHTPALERLKGYRKAYNKQGICLQEDLIRPYCNSEFENPDEFHQEITSIVKDLLEQSKPPSAIFCFNDQIAVLVKEILNEKGLGVPEDISLLGFDDSNMVNLNNISITSVSHPKKAAGKKAAEIILNHIDKNRKVLNKVFKPELIKRSSVRNTSS